MSTIIEQLIEFFKSLFSRASGEAPVSTPVQPQPTPTAAEEQPAPPVETTPQPPSVIELPSSQSEGETNEVVPVTKNVLAVIFNPRVPGAGNETLVHVLGWNDPDALAENLATDLREVSGGYLNYEITERHEVDALPRKKDGFTYNIDEFVRNYRVSTGFHVPDDADYFQILRDFDILTKVTSKEIDEVWMFGPPYSGFHESTMAGAGMFFCNAPPLLGTEDCQRRFIMMGFSYERGVGEMLESFGHRTESIIQQVYRQRVGAANVWERFTRVEKTNPERAEVGTVHFAPNSTRAYEWGSHTLVPSRCENWLKYPDLTGEPVQVNCDNWGGGDIRLHHLWWLRHLPHFPGTSGGIANNWWKYVADANEVK